MANGTHWHVLDGAGPHLWDQPGFKRDRRWSRDIWLAPLLTLRALSLMNARGHQAGNTRIPSMPRSHDQQHGQSLLAPDAYLSSPRRMRRLTVLLRPTTKESIITTDFMSLYERFQLPPEKDSTVSEQCRRLKIRIMISVYDAQFPACVTCNGRSPLSNRPLREARPAGAPGGGPARPPRRAQRSQKRFLLLATCLPFAPPDCRRHHRILLLHWLLLPGWAGSRLRSLLEPVANQTLLQSQPIRPLAAEAFSATRCVARTPPGAGLLTVVISDYRREIATVREGDTGLARKLNVTLGVTCTLRDNRTGKAIWEKRLINATREIFTDSGQLQSEYQALPLLAEALSARVLSAALDAW